MSQYVRSLERTLENRFDDSVSSHEVGQLRESTMVDSVRSESFSALTTKIISEANYVSTVRYGLRESTMLDSFNTENDEEKPIDYIFKEIEKKLIIPRPIFMNKLIPKNKPENEKGNREYKYLLNYNLLDQSVYREKREKKKKEKIASQMLYRLLEGNGKAIYILGIEDDGNNKGTKLKELFDSIHFFIDASKIINAKIKSIKIYNGLEGYICTIRINLDVNLDYNITLF